MNVKKLIILLCFMSGVVVGKPTTDETLSKILQVIAQDAVLQDFVINLHDELYAVALHVDKFLHEKVKSSLSADEQDRLKAISLILKKAMLNYHEELSFRGPREPREQQFTTSGIPGSAAGLTLPRDARFRNLTVDGILKAASLTVADLNVEDLTVTGHTSLADVTVTGTIVLSSLTPAGVVHNSDTGVLSSSLIVNADVDPNAGIVDTKLATIVTPGKVANSATTATAANLPDTIVLRDLNRSFAADAITLTPAAGVGLMVTSNAAAPAVSLIGTGTTAAPALRMFGVPDATITDFILSYDNATGNVNKTATPFGDFIINGGQPGPITIGTTDGTDMTFITSGSARLAIAAGGAVSIQAPSSGVALTVTGNDTAMAMDVVAGAGQSALVVTGDAAPAVQINGVAGQDALSTTIGTVTINTPTTGIALLVSGNAGAPAVGFFGNSTTTAPALAMSGVPDASPTDFILSYDNGSGSVNKTATVLSDFIINGGQPGPITIGTTDGTDMTFITSGSARLAIAAGGAVSINAPSSGVALTVTGNDTAMAMDVVAGAGQSALVVTGDAAPAVQINGFAGFDALSTTIGTVTINPPITGTALTVLGNTTSPAVSLIGTGTTAAPALRMAGVPDATIADFILSYDNVTGNVNKTTTPFGDFIINGGQPGPITIGTTDGTDMTFITSGSARLAIAAGGAVSINAPSSGVALSVTGNTTATAEQITAGAGQTALAVTGSTAPAVIITGVAGVDALVTTTGMVRINAPTSGIALNVTSSNNGPAALLTGAGSASTPALRMAGVPTAATTDLLLSYDNTTGNVNKTSTTLGNFIINGGQPGPITIGTTDGTDMTFITSGSARLAIAAGGAVNINAPSSGVALSVTGNSGAAALQVTAGAGQNAIIAPLGSATAPSYSFIGDTNTGMFSTGADELALATTGTSRLIVDSTGNVTIRDNNSLLLTGTNNAQTVAIKALAGLGTSYTLTLPSTTGTFNQALITTGTGFLTWSGGPETANYVPIPQIGIQAANATRVVQAPPAPLEGGVYYLFQDVTLSSIIFRATAVSGGVLNLGIYQTPTGIYGGSTDIPLVASIVGVAAVVGNNTAALQEGTVTLKAGIIFVLYARTAAGTITLQAYPVTALNLLNTNFVGYPSTYTTGTGPTLPTTINPATFTDTTANTLPILRLSQP